MKMMTMNLKNMKVWNEEFSFSTICLITILYFISLIFSFLFGRSQIFRDEYLQQFFSPQIRVKRKHRYCDEVAFLFMMQLFIKYACETKTYIIDIALI